jgi:Icc-related predicted phosphoesterase
MKYKKILFMGDVHGDFVTMNNILELEKPDLCIQLGDFGIWPRLSGSNFGKFQYDMKHLHDVKYPLYFIEGNHEDYEYLNDNYDSYDGTYLIENEYKKVKHIRRGYIEKINDMNFLFIGGAESIDKQFRTEGISWFPEETITNFDIECILNNVSTLNIKIDVIVSHTCPEEFNVIENKYHDRSPSMKALSCLLHELKPYYWYFGHFHLFKRGIYENTSWTCLNMLNFKGCYKIGVR